MTQFKILKNHEQDKDTKGHSQITIAYKRVYL